jgi:sec-independent protein translocase protein TatB
MFDIGWSELLVIAVVAIVVVGPKELPKLMRSFGFYAGKLRRAAADFRRQFDEAMREAELEEVKQAIESVKTETHALNEAAPLNRPLMVEGPKTSAAKPGEAKPAAKTPRKRSAAKAKTPAKASAKRAKSGAGPAP